MEQSADILPPINARLVQLRQALELNQEGFATLLGLSRSYISNIEAGKRGVSADIITLLIEARSVSAHWLLTGQGSMFFKLEQGEGHLNGQVNGHLNGKDRINHVSNSENLVTTEPQAPYHIKPAQILVATQDLAGNATVPIVNRRAAGNYISGYQTQEYFEELDAMTVPNYMLRGGQGLIVQAANDSMEDTIFDGDLLLCRFVEPSRWDDIPDFTVCVLVSESRGIQVKRVKSRLEKEGLVRCKSDNRRYPAFNLFGEDILQIWQVALLLTAQLPNRADSLYRKVDSIEDSNTDLREVLEQMQERLHQLEGRVSGN